MTGFFIGIIMFIIGLEIILTLDDIISKFSELFFTVKKLVKVQLKNIGSEYFKGK